MYTWIKRTGFLLLILVFYQLSAQTTMIADISENVKTEFGIYQPFLVEITPQAMQYTVEPDFSNVVNFSDFQFNQTELDLLQRNGFVVIPGSFAQIYHPYNHCYDESIPVFVTTDCVLHAYHILYDYILRMLEVEQFAGDLDRLNKAIVAAIQSRYSTVADSSLKETVRKLLAYFSVANVLLDEMAQIPDSVNDLVQAELDLIEGHQGYITSPIFLYQEDYSQYNPRGHYTRSELLKHYFMSMMWLGRMTFTMEPDLYREETKEHTLMALIVVQLLNTLNVESEEAMTVWGRIYDPTVFFVGKSDDLNIYQYTEIGKEVYGSAFTSLSIEKLADATLLNHFIDKASRLPGPLIKSELPGSTPKGFRFMGQRFIPDSYIFDQITAPPVWGRLMPRGLDIMSVLGSERAQEILDDVYHENQNGLYVTWIDSMKTEFSNKPSEEWAQNLYWNWLYSLMPLLFAKGSGYPPFMQKEAWLDKELTTSLGSWAELRHDTILYAKQSSSFESIPPIPSLIKGYVEPNPHLYARLAALARFMITGFDNREILLDHFRNRLEELESLLLTLKSVSEKELTNQIPLKEEYVLIQRFGQIIETIITFSSEEAGEFQNETDEEMPVIADVHTDALNNLALEVGVGYPFDIYVIAPIEDTLRVTRGAIFSYYEFAQPISNRLTDEAWQEMQKSDSPQIPPVWTGSYLDTSQNFVNKYPYPYYSNEPYTGIDKSYPKNPIKIRLRHNYPNPFNPETSIVFELSNRNHIILTVYNLLGRKIRTLFVGVKEAGIHTVQWNGRDEQGIDVPTGLYFYRIEAGNIKITQKMSLIR